MYQHSVGMPLLVEAIFDAKPCIPLGMRLLLELSVALSTERCIPNGMRVHTLRAASTERCVPNGTLTLAGIFDFYRYFIPKVTGCCAAKNEKEGFILSAFLINNK